MSVESTGKGDRSIAVLIDQENVSVKALGRLFDQLAATGRMIVRRAYGEWTNEGMQRAWEALIELGVEPIHVMKASKSGKNASDIRLVVDAMELLSDAQADTFVIVSGDADFLPLVNKLRASGKITIGAGRRDAVGDVLVRAFDQYVYLDEQGQEPPLRLLRPIDSIQMQLLVSSVQDIQASGDQVLGSRLHATMQRRDPAFDFHKAGYGSFSSFLEASGVVVVSPPAGQGDVVVKLPDKAKVEDNKEPPTAPADTEKKIDAAWSIRAPASGDKIAGPSAAADAARILDVSKLKSSQFKTLQKLLEGMSLLARKWRRDGNAIFRK